jgi:hypothetical protein
MTTPGGTTGPTGVGSFDWRDELEAVVGRHLTAAGVDGYGGDGAADVLAENGLPDNAAFAIRRDNFRLALDRHARTHRDDRGVVVHGPDRHDQWDLRALYGDIMFALARPAARRTARILCELVGWDPDGPIPPTGTRCASWAARHRIRNVHPTTAISLHVYGTDITRVGTSARRFYN